LHGLFHPPGRRCRLTEHLPTIDDDVPERSHTSIRQELVVLRANNLVSILEGDRESFEIAVIV
jgi:hypothetical protein